MSLNILRSKRCIKSSKNSCPLRTNGLSSLYLMNKTNQPKSMTINNYLQRITSKMWDNGASSSGKIRGQFGLKIVKAGCLSSKESSFREQGKLLEVASLPYCYLLTKMIKLTLRKEHLLNR